MSVTQLITKVYFINKGSSSNKVTLVENDAIIINDRVISTTMNRFLIKIKTIKKPNLKPFKISSDNDINQITSVFENNVCIRKIQGWFPNIEASEFNFSQVSLNEVKSEILNLNIKTSHIKGSISATILKQCVDICS